MAVAGDSLPVRIALYAGIAALSGTAMLAIGIVAVRTAIGINAARAARALARWRPLFARTLISGSQPERGYPRLGRRERIPVMIMWNHLQESIRGGATAELAEAGRRAGLDTAAQAMLGRRSAGKRLIAAVTLGNLRDATAWDGLLAAAAEPRTALSLAAAHALMRIDARRAVPALVSMIVSRPDWHPSRVSEMLAEAGGETAAEALASALETAPAAARPRLVRELEATRSVSILPVVRGLLASAPDPDTIAACIHALAALQDPRDATLVRRFSTHDSWFVRAQVAHALGRLGTGDDVPTLKRFLGDQAWWVRYRAAMALTGMRSVSETLLEEIRVSHPDRMARDILAHAIAERDFE